MHHIVEHERECCGDGAVGKVAAAQLAERAADDRLDGNFGPGLQRAAQSHQALAAAQVVAVAVADRVTSVSADDQGEQSLGAVQVAQCYCLIAMHLLKIELGYQQCEKINM